LVNDIFQHYFARRFELEAGAGSKLFLS